MPWRLDGMARPGSHRLFVSARVGVAAAGLALVQPVLGPELPLAAVEMTSLQPQMRVLVAEGATGIAQSAHCALS